MQDRESSAIATLDPGKFNDPEVTANGQPRAVVALSRLATLWFNTGTLCNLTCETCYMQSSPRNDQLAYISAAEAGAYLDEIVTASLPVQEIGFTGGEPFMNPELPDILEASLSRGFRALVLSNAMRPMQIKKAPLLAVHQAHGEKLSIRVSIDHYTQEKHDELRGTRAWNPMIEGLEWLIANRFNLAVAGRNRWAETEDELRAGYARLFDELGLADDAQDPARLVLFPEMDDKRDVPEISTACWDVLGVQPEAMMCATSRMVIKRNGAEHPVVVPCTLLPYDAQFDLGRDLTGSAGAVNLNHPHCARFCVLGGGSCSVGGN